MNPTTGAFGWCVCVYVFVCVCIGGEGSSFALEDVSGV